MKELNNDEMLLLSAAVVCTSCDMMQKEKVPLPDASDIMTA